MPNIPSNLNKMNDIEVASEAPMTEALMNKMGANINGLIDLAGIAANSQEFISSGTFNVPEDVTSVLVEMIGGGGGGSEGENFPPSTGPGGTGGNSAARILQLVSVTPLSAITVTIGAGGSGGFIVGSGVKPGGKGGNTSFGSLTALGAEGGLNNAQLQPNISGGLGGQGTTSGGGGLNGQSSQRFSGGVGGTAIVGGGGGGAASYYGPGAAGGNSSGATGNTAAATSYGAGGGGGASQSGPGGFGAPGYVKVWW